ncbi:hypothetical protein LSAT2_016383 [Lamellibrachia satsuma]|nr:hypothetical protein LSAT2_016383 [Lamellibrachia satsuma]
MTIGKSFPWYEHRGAALKRPHNGEPLSTIGPPESRSRPYVNRGAAIDTRAIGSRPRRSSHRGADIDGITTREPLSTAWSLGSYSRRAHRPLKDTSPRTRRQLKLQYKSQSQRHHRDHILSGRNE